MVGGFGADAMTPCLGVWQVLCGPNGLGVNSGVTINRRIGAAASIHKNKLIRIRRNRLRPPAA